MKATVIPNEAATGQLSASAVGAPQAPQQTGVCYSFNWVVVQKQYRATAGDAWTDTNSGTVSIPVNPAGSGNQLSSFSAIFTNSGQYKITLKANRKDLY